jgi:hypothetical protein
MECSDSLVLYQVLRSVYWLCRLWSPEPARRPTSPHTSYTPTMTLAGSSHCLPPDNRPVGSGLMLTTTQPRPHSQARCCLLLWCPAGPQAGSAFTSYPTLTLTLARSSHWLPPDTPRSGFGLCIQNQTLNPPKPTCNLAAFWCCVCL